MSKLRRGTQTALSEAASLRLRAAWMYYNHGATQKEVAEQLGISRSTVIRLLDEATKRGEVRIWIEEGESRCISLAVELERVLGLDEAVIVPETKGTDQAAKAVGAALGKFLSEAISDDMSIGVGWGRTLTASLGSFRPPRHTGVRVMSLLGGVIDSNAVNPVEFSWRLASQLDAACFQFPAPLIVDSAATRRSLIERCGIDRLFAMASELDLAVLSVGDLGPRATSLSGQVIDAAELAQLLKLGAVGDVMCNFLDVHGRTIDHPIKERVMSIDLDTIARAKHRVLAGGGAHRAVAIYAAMQRLGCNTLITDEGAANAILELKRKSVDL